MPTQFKFQTHTSGISIPFTGLVFLLTLAGLSGSQLAAVQIVSPSTNTLPEGARIAEETAPIEPSVQLLNSLESLLPFKLKDSGIEDQMLSGVRKFISGLPNEAHAQFEEIRATKTELPPASLILAGLFFGAGDAPNARLMLERAAFDEPEYPTTWSGLARMAINDQRLADAQAILEKADRLNTGGTWSEAQTLLFRKEYLDGMADVSIARQQFDNARTWLLELRELALDNSTVPLRLAQVEFDTYNIEKSVEYLHETRKISTDLRVPEAIIADWYSRKNEMTESEKWLKLASEKNPEDVNVILDQARWLLNNEKFPEALATIVKADAKGVNPAVSQFMKGQVAFARRDYAGAEAAFETLSRQKPGDADTTNMLALSLAESRDMAKRERGLELSMVNQRLYPKSVTAAATVGWLYFKLDRIKEAENIFQQVAQINTLEPSSAYFFAHFLYKQSDLKTAKVLLEGAIGSQNYFMYRAAANELLDKVKLEVAELEKANPEGSGGTTPEKKSDDG